IARLGPSAPLLADVAKYLAVAIGVALVLWALWTFTRRGGRTRAGRYRSGNREQLRDAAWYRSQADLLAARGLHDEAVQSEFLALVLELDEHRWLRFHASKTPAEYATELADSGHDAGAFRVLVRL